MDPVKSVVKLDDIVQVGGVDAMFYSKVVNLAVKQYGNSRCEVHELEAMRRAVALIEAVMTKKVIIES